MPAGPVRPNWSAQAPAWDQNPSSYTSGVHSAGIWLAAPAVSMAAARPPVSTRPVPPDERQDGTAAEEAESLIGQAVAEVLAVLPRAGRVHQRAPGRQCSHGPGLWWHPARIISSHPRSITPAQPARLVPPGVIDAYRRRP